MKSHEEHLTISEFSEIVGISAETLRYYDRKGIFRPAKYGEGENNKYRYYSPTQITAIEDEITVVDMPELRVSLGAVNDFTDSYKFFREFICFCQTPHKPILNLAYPIGGYFEDMTAFLDEPSQPTQFFSLDPKGCDHKEAGLYLVGYTRGYYGDTNNLPDRMIAYAKDNDLTFSGPVYELYLFDEVCITDPKQYLLQITASVTKTTQSASHNTSSFFETK